MIDFLEDLGELIKNLFEVIEGLFVVAVCGVISWILIWAITIILTE
ncbi:hypothetical protein [Levilactobacillus suantsaii]|nr:hypothetical protein [Levilactobacillus suantsaii]QMU08754.1 hypothetical protein H3M12_03585 [Levilactobacillus suantsaii]